MQVNKVKGSVINSSKKQSWLPAHCWDLPVL